MRWQARLAAVAVLAAVSGAPAITPQEIVERSRHTLDGVDTFITLMTFSMRSTNVRVPNTRLRIYFKKPDNIRPEAVDGDFTVLPQTYKFAVGNILDRMARTHTVQYVREERLGERPQHLLKLTPRDRNSEISYHLVHVDQESYTVTRIRSQPKEEPVAVVSLGYRRHGRAWLPSEGTIHATVPRRRDGREEQEQITVSLRFSDYRLNVPIRDDFFTSGQR